MTQLEEENSTVQERLEHNLETEIRLSLKSEE
jgi:hypothetical protein